MDFLQINAVVKMSSIRVEAWHESEAGVLNTEVFSNSSAITKLTPVSSDSGSAFLPRRSRKIRCGLEKYKQAIGACRFCLHGSPT